MPLFRTAIALVILSASSLLAQPFYIGDPFPLTHARYGSARGHLPLLLTANGRDPLLFWSDDRYVRTARLIDGQPTMSRAVAEGDAFESDFDAIWTGNHFLVVSTAEIGYLQRFVVGRIVSSTGAPVGEQFTIVEGTDPRIAFNGEHVLLLYVAKGTIDVHALLLTPSGARAEPEPRPLGITRNGRMALTSNGSTFAAVIPRDLQPHVLLFDANGYIQSDAILGDYGRGVSIASDGRRYLAVGACSDAGLCGTVYARIVDTDGSMSAPLELDPPFPLHPSAVWTGAEWVISYMRPSSDAATSTLQLLHLDPSASRVNRRSQIAGAQSSLAVIGGNLVTAWVAGNESRDSILVDGVPSTFHVKRQALLATASAAQSTLVAWQEIGDQRTTMHVGVRDRDGLWSEHELLSIPKPACCYEQTLSAMSASNGQEFLLVTSATGTRYAYRFDAHGTPIGDPISLPIAVDQILWDGTSYLLLNDDAVMRLSSNGVLSAQITLSSHVGQSAKFATDGNGNLYAVWIVHIMRDHVLVPAELAGIRLGSNFQALDAEPTTLAATDDTRHPAITWDGVQYAIAWSAPAGLQFVHVSTSGTRSTTRTVAPGNVDQITLTRVADSSAILWRDGIANYYGYLQQDGTITPRFTISFIDPGLLVALPNDGFAYLEVRSLEEAPYEGVDRITMRVGSISPLRGRPRAPQASLHGSVLQWTAPAEEVNGYRAEVRVADGPWVELPTTFGPEQRSAAVPVGTSHHSYRVRAWNDEGVGQYSESVVVNAPRRRSVR